MSTEAWQSVDHFFESSLIGDDPVQASTLNASDEAGLPDIQVSPPQGKFLMMLAKIAGARRILELGTLGGYSTIWLARALPAGGGLISLELDPRNAGVARNNIENAGFGEMVETLVGPALESLKRLVSEAAAPFDLVFIDADK